MRMASQPVTGDTHGQRQIPAQIHQLPDGLRLGPHAPGVHDPGHQLDRVTAGYLSLATFPNETGLERLGGSLWARTTNSGPPIVGTPDTPGFGSTIGGELEQSNVDMATEMTNMITAERGYQANSRVISTADEMLATLVTMNLLTRRGRERGT